MNLEEVKRGFFQKKFNLDSSFYVKPLNDYVSLRRYKDEDGKDGEFYFVVDGGGIILKENDLIGQDFRFQQ